MSSRPFIKPNSVAPFFTGAMSSTNTINSPASIINLIPGVSYEVDWTGTPTGTFAVQVSNSYSENPDGSVLNAGNWTTLPSSSFVGTYPAPAGAPGNGFLNLAGIESYAVRLSYTNASGAGTLTVYIAGKVQ